MHYKTNWHIVAECGLKRGLIDGGQAIGGIAEIIAKRALRTAGLASLTTPSAAGNPIRNGFGRPRGQWRLRGGGVG